MTTAVATTGKNRKDITRSKPTLVQLGNRIVPSDGRWHPELVADYILQHGGRERWIPVGELARVFFGGNTPSNKRRVRQRLFRVWHELLDRGHVLVAELVGRAAQACKIYDPRSVEERQYLQQRLERMEKQRMLRADQLARAVALAECLEQAVPEGA